MLSHAWVIKGLILPAGLELMHSKTIALICGTLVDTWNSRSVVQCGVYCESVLDLQFCQRKTKQQPQPAMEVLLPGRSRGPSLWGARMSDCICSLGSRVVGVATERLQSWPPVKPIERRSPLTHHVRSLLSARPDHKKSPTRITCRQCNKRHAS